MNTDLLTGFTGLIGLMLFSHRGAELTEQETNPQKSWNIPTPKRNCRKSCQKNEVKDKPAARSNGGPRSVVADPCGGRDRARPSRSGGYRTGNKLICNFFSQRHRGHRGIPFFVFFVDFVVPHLTLQASGAFRRLFNVA